MALLKLLRSLRRAPVVVAAGSVAAPATVEHYESEEASLSRELEALERDCPGWREDTRVDNAKLRLLRGIDPERVRSIFGEATYQEALVQLQAVGEPGVPEPSEAYARAAALVVAGSSV
jgi:hypothetical protein